jgi:hypothetical protein
LGTRLSRTLSRAACGAVALALLYTLLLVFPEPLFAHRIEEGPFILHSRRPLSRDRIAPQLKEAERRLARSEIYQNGGTHRVFITGSPALYRLLNGPYYRSMARNVDMGNAILLPELDARGARVLHFDGRTAPLEEILAHEAIHSFVQDHLGLLRALRLPFWKKEGYAQYVALDFLPFAAGIQSLASDEEPSVPRHYLEAAVVWAYLMQVEQQSFDAVMSEAEPFSALLARARRAAEGGP